MSRTYLGTELTPDAYYKTRAADYNNPHAAGVREILTRLDHYIFGIVLDLGCGDGLATKLLKKPGRSFIGMDPSEPMLARYKKETSNDAQLGSATDAMPACDSIVASYSLHLEPNVSLMSFRLWESRATYVVIVSPLKSVTLSDDYFKLVEEARAAVGSKSKTIYGAVYKSRDELLER